MGNYSMQIFQSLYDNVLQYIQLIEWTDIVDVLIVAFIIYKAARWLKATSAAQVIKGIILILFASWISSFIGLESVSFLLSRALEMGFLALIIMFQPELRRVLEHMGGGNWSSMIFENNKSGYNIQNTIDQTLLACMEMAKQKVGALIVFERAIKLDDYTKTGTILNANVSADLLKNLFFPKAALHDGAVIIRNGKILAAGCVLPLTSNPNLSRDLGMRHRAAIGASESSDAVVVIVSEETGSISLASGGMLKRHLATETLQRLLQNELMPESGESNKTTGFIAKLFKTKH